MSLKKIASGPNRQFQIIVGLREGYGQNGKVHTIDEFVTLVTEHLKKRATEKLPYLSGMVAGAQVCYAWLPNRSMDAESQSEPVAIYHGNVSPLYNKDMLNVEALELLTLMAEEFAEAFQQTRVYVSFAGEIHIFQREGVSHPRDQK